MEENPFKKNEGKKDPAPRPEPPKSQIQVDEELTDLCPFIGTIPMMSMPQAGILTNRQQMPEVNHVMSPCIQGRCAMWDVTNESCSIKLANEAMIDIVEPLEALAKAFGKR